MRNHRALKATSRLIPLSEAGPDLWPEHHRLLMAENGFSKRGVIADFWHRLGECLEAGGRDLMCREEGGLGSDWKKVPIDQLGSLDLDFLDYRHSKYGVERCDAGPNGITFTLDDYDERSRRSIEPVGWRKLSRVYDLAIRSVSPDRADPRDERRLRIESALRHARAEKLITPEMHNKQVRDVILTLLKLDPNTAPRGYSDDTIARIRRES